MPEGIAAAWVQALRDGLVPAGEEAALLERFSPFMYRKRCTRCSYVYVAEQAGCPFCGETRCRWASLDEPIGHAFIGG